jgi:hypothetical protein
LAIGERMSDDDGFWKALKDHKKEKFDSDRKRFLDQAIKDDDGLWTKHTQWHWSRMINGERLDYWPSRKKFQFKGKIMRGLKAMYSIKENV